MKKHNITVRLLVFAMVFALFGFASCGKKEEGKTNNTNLQAKQNQVKFTVKSQVADWGKITEYIDYAGTVRSSNTLVVLPQVSGKIIKLYKEVGDPVSRGDLLFELEDTLYQALYEQAKAQLASSRISLKDAEKNKKRIQAVYKKKGISDSKYEQALSAYDIAQNRLKQAEAGFKAAEFNYKSTKVKAPFDGTITAKYKEKGDFINPQMSGGIGVYTLENYSTVYIDVDVPATEAVRLKKDLSADILLENQILSGRVLTVNQKTDPYSSSVSLRIRVKNREGKISPGSIVKTRIHYLEKNRALIIPNSALLNDDKVFVLTTSERVQERTVRIGMQNPEKVEILEGVKEGEKVIVEGNFGLYNNAPVQEK